MEPSEEDLLRWDRTHVWHAFTQMAEYEPLVIERAEGCWLIDQAGRRYLDGVSSLWCNVHGHQHPRMNAAILEQLQRVAHVTSLGLSNPTTIQLAKALADLTANQLPHVFFSDSGASAVEVALKLAFQYWRQKREPEPHRTKFLAFESAYHGDTLGSVSVSGVARFQAMFAPLLFETIRLPLPDANRLPPGVTREQGAEYYLAQVAAALREHASSLAAVVIEPLVQCAAGMVMHPPGFLRGLRALTQQHGVLLIADEVAVGVGRTGTFFACEQEQVVPDLMCLAKGLTGGYLPVAATLATTEIWNAFLGTYAESRTFFHGHTYGGNPLGCAAALASLAIFREEQTLSHLPAKMARLAMHLERLAKLPHVGNVRQRGMIAALDLVTDKTSGQLIPWEQKRGLAVCSQALREGVWLRPLGSTLVVMPPLAISLEEIDFLFAALERAIIREFAEGGGVSL
jgi:adenosylmethionine-8-amino-7-oxononanoate aminotransferase